MKQFYYSICLLFIISANPSLFGQITTNRVLVTVDWPNESSEHKVEIRDPANNLLVTFCNTEDCYNADGTSTNFSATYDLGCLAIDPMEELNYTVVLFDAADNGWSPDSIVTVNVGGEIVFTNIGNNANLVGDTHIFNVNSANECTLLDTDQDGVIDLVDQDDDNDGILDVVESLGLDEFTCTIPTLNFVGNGNVAESGTAGQVGAIYRFENVLAGYDVLVEILAIDNTELLNIDNDVLDVANSLQTELKFSGEGIPGIEFEFRLVDTGTSDLASTIFRIGGTTWDCDGTDILQESVRYYDPSAYGLDNPTSLTIDDYIDGAGITAANTSYQGFSTNTILRSYFQFESNTFKIRMQAKKTNDSEATRLYAMSFTQCDIFDYEAPLLTIISGLDTDGDELDNQLDLDSDNDGIPDNIESQPTSTYIPPNGVFDAITGIDTAYAIVQSLQDTDGDGIFDINDLDSDGDGTPDIRENGMADSITTFADDDEDGLDNLFETNGVLDVIWDVNEDIEDPTDLTILPDTDEDLSLGGDLDYRDLFDINPPTSATIDFDGFDDYVEAFPSVINDQNEFTISFWIKPESLPSGGENDTRFVLGQKGRFEIEIGNDQHGDPNIWAKYYYGTDSSSRIGVPISTNEWMHYTVTVNFNNDLIQVFKNGEPSESLSPLNTPLSNGNPLRMGSKEEVQPAVNSNYKGWLDEVRIFYGALTSDQIQQMVYQEIKQNGTYLQGTVIEKDIADFTDDLKVLWTDLASYYPMSNILNSKLIDQSSYNIDAVLYNIQSALPQTAPIPYETGNNGDWTDVNTWLHGGVWDIEDLENNKDWIIVKLNDNVTTSNSHITLGMFMGSKKTLTVKDDNSITNNWYLQLDGTIDLENDSQLIQGMNSDLVTSDEGKILRRQEGNSNFYWYNYWSSPVGSISTTVLSDNNSPSNNENNSPFNLGMLKDNNGDDIVFTSDFHGEGMVSDRWLFSYLNGLTFWDWITLTPTSDIAPGVGYTQKGTGIDSNPDPLITEQQYTFVGKPNNGTILIQADDVDDGVENESEQDETLTTSFVGNPYPSALDARKFIDDNEGVIGGSVYVWEQWSGISHILEEYEGGYGTINDVTTERAYQWNDLNPVPEESPFARKPTFYIPVAQGFFVEVVNDGDNGVLSAEDDIEFNNGQRIFIKESAADGTNPNNGSVFFRDGNPDTNDSSQNIGMMRLELKVSNGNSRSFVLAFSDATTDGYDYGYDARTIDPQDDDLNSFLGDEKMIIQSFSPITDDKEIDLVFNSTGIYNYTIEMVEILDIPEEQPIYLLDNLTGTYFDLRSGAYDFSSDFAGEDSERFDIVFQEETLSDEEELFSDVLIFVNNANKRLYIKGLTEPIENLVITNLLGQNVISLKHLDHNSLENGFYLGELSSGLYLVNLITENGIKLNKKIILE